jgi:hypothetical protein
MSQVGNCKPKVFLLGLVLIVAALFRLPPFLVPLAFSEEHELSRQSSKLDVVLLVDSSGSMLSTDPLRLRYEGAKLLLQFLSKEDRLAVVSFAATASVSRPLSPFDPAQSDVVMKEIESVEATGTYTDLLEAIKTGKYLLESDPRDDAQRVMVLLSDGKMEPDPAVSLPMARTQDLVSNYLPDLKAKEIKVHTLAFSDQADRALLSEVAGASDGLSWYTLSPNEIHKSFADLFLTVKRPQVVPLTSRGFRIDDDVQEATFYIVHEEGVTLTMTSPKGQAISESEKPDGVKWFSSAQFDVITLERPTKGDWQVHGVTSSDGFATVLTNLKLTTEWPTTVRSDEPVLLQGRLFESEKPVALPSMTGVIKYAFQISPTDKVSEPIIRETLVDDGTLGDKVEKDGIFGRLVTIHDPGEYKLTIVARGPTFQRTQQLPFRVRPRLITLTAELPEEGHGAGGHHGGHAESGSGAHGGSNHSDEHAPPDEAHGAEGEDAAGESADPKADGSGVESKNEIIKGDGRWVFRVTLSSEVTSFKKFDVKLTARDANRKKYELPLKRSLEDSTVMEFFAVGLPADGQYLMEARLIAETKKRQEVEAESRPLRFERVTSGKENASAVKVIVLGQEKEPAPAFPLVPLLCVLVANFGVGGALFLKLRKGQANVGPVAEKYTTPPEVVAFIRQLEERAAMTEVDVNDLIFTEIQSPQTPILDAPTPEAEPEGSQES